MARGGGEGWLLLMTVIGALFFTGATPLWLMLLGIALVVALNAIF